MMHIQELVSAASDPWQFGWDALAAIGTIGATVAATWIALAEGGRRRRDGDARSRTALVMLWPDLRRYLSAIRIIRHHAILIKPLVTNEESLELQRVIHALISDTELVLKLVRDLDGVNAEKMALVLAYTRHAHRHLIDIHMAAGAYEDTIYLQKSLAAKTAIGLARKELVPLIAESRRLMGVKISAEDLEN